MKAVVHSRYGPPAALELKDIDTPLVTDNAVLVQVHAAAVGKGDWLTVRGLPYVARVRYGLRKPKHPVPGFDVAGRVEAVGKSVIQLQAGDEVFGWCEGSFAEYASVPEGQLVLKPANLTFEQAAAVPISGFAALQALRDTGGVHQRFGCSGAVWSAWEDLNLAPILIRHIRGMRSCCWSEGRQLFRAVELTVVVRYVPGLTVRCGTRVAWPVRGEGLEPAVGLLQRRRPSPRTWPDLRVHRAWGDRARTSSCPVPSGRGPQLNEPARVTALGA
jgi:hypothetical protein